MEEKINEKIEDKKNENGGEHMSGYFINKRSLWFMAGGALGAFGGGLKEKKKKNSWGGLGGGLFIY